MQHGDDSSDYDKHAFGGMDELLCEYVDGTMDPGVRQVFEEYMQDNPELAEHVENLRETRDLLYRYRCQIHAPFGFGRRLHREVTDQMMHLEQPGSIPPSEKVRQATSFTSIFMAVMVVGLVTGSLFVEEGPVVRESIREVVESSDGLRPAQISDRMPMMPPVKSSFGSLDRMFLVPPRPAFDVTLPLDTLRKSTVYTDQSLLISSPLP